MAREGETERQWHLDRKVPITLALAIVTFFIGGVRWVGGVESDQLAIDRRVTTLESAQGDAKTDHTKVAVLEATLEALKVQVAESRKVLDEIRTLLIQERAQDRSQGATPKGK